MEKAIELAAYYLWQHRLIHTHNSPESGLASVALKVQKYVERVGESTASKLKSGVRALRNMAAVQIRELMKTLANTGYGQVQGEGAEMKYAAMPPPKIDTDDVELTRSSIPIPQAAQALPIPVDTIDIPPEPITESSSSYQDGMAVEVWRDDKWHPAKYIGTVLNSVLSHITRKLDDGHLVKFRHSHDPATRVASTDLRLAQSAYP